MGAKRKAKSQAALAVQRAVKVRRRLLNAAQKTPETLLIQYDTSYEGFDEEKIEDMRDQYGVNEITKVKKETVFKKLFDAFVNPFTIVLVALALVSLYTEFIIPEAPHKELTAVIIVAAMVTVSGLLRFIQEFRGGKAAERLTEMVETTVATQRTYTDEEDEDIQDSRREEIPLDELVVGDVIFLAAGDMIPADVRILQAKDLFVSQASLTGESEPVEKFAAPVQSKSRQPLEINNLAFMGSNVISGSAAALVLAVGDETNFGQIARQLQEKRPQTSFEKGIRSVSWVLIRFMAIMVPVVFFINSLDPVALIRGDVSHLSDPTKWIDSLMFALAVAVGLTPQMLPMIVSANLAKGAVSMSKKRVIVKDLNSIQNFGAMDILCTDKTGTITQDKIILEYHLNIEGEESERVLRHAFLNSYHQTGLKNLMDVSIIETANEYEEVDYWKTYQKVDEIPFDFNRRRMSVVVIDQGGKTQMITKGAIEEMLSVCTYAEVEGDVVPITEKIRKRIIERCREYNADGLRVLGLAQRTNLSQDKSYSVNDESEMVLIGYLAFLDPPKESAEEAIAALQDFGVDVKVLTGDNDAVTRCVCKQVGINTERILLGADVEAMSDERLKESVEKVTVFAKLSPQQKARIVNALRENGHVVGFMGDGINDASAMRAADVGISVDNAVDIAKESANIILMEKDLMVLEEGVVEGRKIYANIIKYIKMTASSNFGNMFSVLAASAFLPFLPMLPLQILFLNLIYDISCITIPWDNVDMDYLKKPRTWDASSITKFMLWIGPTSSIFDLTTFGLLFWVIGPGAIKGGFAADPANFTALFHAGWFVMSLWTQTLVVHMIRTPKLPFIQSRASWQLTGLTTLGIAVGTALPFIPFTSGALEMNPLPGEFFLYLVATVLCYMLLVTVIKKLFVRKYGELL